MTQEIIREAWGVIVGAAITGGALGSLLTLFISHRLALQRGRTVRVESDLRAQKALIIPALKRAIKDCSTDDPLVAWNQHRDAIQKAALAFSTYLRGRRQKAFENAWAVRERTTNEELSTDEIGPAQKLIVSRLEAVLEIVDAA